MSSDRRRARPAKTSSNKSKKDAKKKRQKEPEGPISAREQAFLAQIRGMEGGSRTSMNRSSNADHAFKNSPSVTKRTGIEAYHAPLSDSDYSFSSDQEYMKTETKKKGVFSKIILKKNRIKAHHVEMVFGQGVLRGCRDLTTTYTTQISSMKNSSGKLHMEYNKFDLIPNNEKMKEYRLNTIEPEDLHEQITSRYGKVTAMGIHPSGNLFAFGTESQKHGVIVFDREKVKFLEIKENHMAEVTCIEFHDPEQMILVGCRSGAVLVFQRKKGQHHIGSDYVKLHRFERVSRNPIVSIKVLGDIDGILACDTMSILSYAKKEEKLSHHQHTGDVEVTEDGSEKPKAQKNEKNAKNTKNPKAPKTEAQIDREEYRKGRRTFRHNTFNFKKYVIGKRDCFPKIEVKTIDGIQMVFFLCGSQIQVFRYDKEAKEIYLGPTTKRATEGDSQTIEEIDGSDEKAGSSSGGKEGESEPDNRPLRRQRTSLATLNKTELDMILENSLLEEPDETHEEDANTSKDAKKKGDKGSKADRMTEVTEITDMTENDSKSESGLTEEEKGQKTTEEPISPTNARKSSETGSENQKERTLTNTSMEVSSADTETYTIPETADVDSHLQYELLPPGQLISGPLKQITTIEAPKDMRTHYESFISFLRYKISRRNHMQTCCMVWGHHLTLYEIITTNGLVNFHLLDILKLSHKLCFADHFVNSVKIMVDDMGVVYHYDMNKHAKDYHYKRKEMQDMKKISKIIRQQVYKEDSETKVRRAMMKAKEERKKQREAERRASEMKKLEETGQRRRTGAMSNLSAMLNGLQFDFSHVEAEEKGQKEEEPITIFSKAKKMLGEGRKHQTGFFGKNKKLEEKAEMYIKRSGIILPAKNMLEFDMSNFADKKRSNSHFIKCVNNSMMLFTTDGMKAYERWDWIEFIEECLDRELYIYALKTINEVIDQTPILLKNVPRKYREIVKVVKQYLPQLIEDLLPGIKSGKLQENGNFTDLIINTSMVVLLKCGMLDFIKVEMHQLSAANNHLEDYMNNLRILYLSQLIPKLEESMVKALLDSLKDNDVLRAQLVYFIYSSKPEHHNFIWNYIQSPENFFVYAKFCLHGDAHQAADPLIKMMDQVWALYNSELVVPESDDEDDEDEEEDVKEINDNASADNLAQTETEELDERNRSKVLGRQLFEAVHEVIQQVEKAPGLTEEKVETVDGDGSRTAVSAKSEEAATEIDTRTETEQNSARKNRKNRKKKTGTKLSGEEQREELQKKRNQEIKEIINKMMWYFYECTIRNRQILGTFKSDNRNWHLYNWMLDQENMSKLLIMEPKLFLRWVRFYLSKKTGRELGRIKENLKSVDLEAYKKYGIMEEKECPTYLKYWMDKIFDLANKNGPFQIALFYELMAVLCENKFTKTTVSEEYVRLTIEYFIDNFDHLCEEKELGMNPNLLVMKMFGVYLHNKKAFKKKESEHIIQKMRDKKLKKLNLILFDLDEKFKSTFLMFERLITDEPEFKHEMFDWISFGLKQPEEKAKMIKVLENESMFLIKEDHEMYSDLLYVMTVEEQMEFILKYKPATKSKLEIFERILDFVRKKKKENDVPKEFKVEYINLLNKHERKKVMNELSSGKYPSQECLKPCMDARNDIAVAFLKERLGFYEEAMGIYQRRMRKCLKAMSRGGRYDIPQKRKLLLMRLYHDSELALDICKECEYGEKILFDYISFMVKTTKHYRQRPIKEWIKVCEDLVDYALRYVDPKKLIAQIRDDDYNLIYDENLMERTVYHFKQLRSMFSSTKLVNAADWAHANEVVLDGLNPGNNCFMKKSDEVGDAEIFFASCDHSFRVCKNEWKDQPIYCPDCEEDDEKMRAWNKMHRLFNREKKIIFPKDLVTEKRKKLHDLLKPLRNNTDSLKGFRNRMEEYDGQMGKFQKFLNAMTHEDGEGEDPLELERKRHKQEQKEKEEKENQQNVLLAQAKKEEEKRKEEEELKKKKEQEEKKRREIEMRKRKAALAAKKKREEEKKYFGLGKLKKKFF